ncbi:MAG: hypothetical protein ACRYF3_12135 [Janthinobacterium lividum]
MIWFDCGPETGDLLGSDDVSQTLLAFTRDWFEQFGDETTSVAVSTGHPSRPDGWMDVRVLCCVRHGVLPEMTRPLSPLRPGLLDLLIQVQHLGELAGAVCEALVADAPAVFVDIRVDPAAVPGVQSRPDVIDLRGRPSRWGDALSHPGR